MFHVQLIQTKSGKHCPVLVADLGYRKAYISFDTSLLSEITGLSVKALYELKEPVYLGRE